MAHAQRYETKQDFDEAFEELYQRSPMPQQVKPLLAAYWSPVPQVTQGHGTGVKAIFDMMKRNTSISSDLNTSCTSVDTTFTSDRTDNQQNNGEVPKDKENLMPEKDSGRGVVATEERQLPPVPPFPTAHCSAIVSRHGALVNGPELPKSPLPQAMRSSEQSGWAVIELSDKTTEILSFSTSNQGVFNHDSTLSSPEEKSADQETLKLVSKLVQRLQSSAESDLDSFDDTEQSPSRQTRNTAFTGHGSIQQQQKISKTVGTKANGGSEGVDITSKKQRKTRATNEADNFGQQNGVSAAESAAQQVSSNGASKPSGSLRRQKLQRHTGKPSDTTIEREDTVDTGHNQNSRRKETWSVTRFQTDTVTQNTTEHVEVDTIAQESAGPLPSDTDIFSLNLSSEDHAEEVENDAILFASQKSRLAAMASSSMSSHQHDFRTRHVSSHPGPLPRKRKLMEESASLAEEHSKKYKGKAWPLRSWSLQPVPRLKGVRVEGKLPNTDYYWCSSVIMHRVGGRTLKSNNGSLYSLIGNMSIANTMHAGFSKDLAKKFYHGFPEDWKDLIQAELELNSMKTNLSAVVEENMLESPTEGNQEQVKSKDHSKAASKAVTCRNLNVVIDDIRREIPARVSQEQERPKTSKSRTELRDAHIPVPKTRDNQGSFHTPEPQKKNEKSSPIWTPQGVVSRALGADQVRRTQSGRCVIPPLARWAGQYVEKDADGNVIIGFQSQAAEQHFAKMAEQEMSILARRRGMKSVSLFSSYVNSPSSIVGRKAASTATTKSHRAQQNKTSAVEPQIEWGPE